MTCDEGPQISKVLWALGVGKTLLTVGMLRKDPRKEARNRCLINMLKLASSFFWVPKDWIFDLQRLVAVWWLLSVLVKKKQKNSTIDRWEGHSSCKGRFGQSRGQAWTESRLWSLYFVGDGDATGDLEQGYVPGRVAHEKRSHMAAESRIHWKGSR